MKIAEFADAIGDPNPVYRDPGRRPGRRLTRRHRAADVPHRRSRRRLPRSPTRSWASTTPWSSTASSASSTRRPLHAGDVVISESTIAGSGRSAATTHDHHRRGHRRSRASTCAPPARRSWSGEALSEADQPKYDAVAVGDELPPRDLPGDPLDLVKYAGASGDFNPIHWNERVATSVGLPDVIAHGMFTMAQAGRFVTDWAGDPGAVVELRRPVLPPGGRARRRRRRRRRGQRHGRGEARRQQAASRSSPPAGGRRCSARRKALVRLA